MTSALERLSNLDRRWLFLAMAIAIVGPLLWPVEMPFSVSPMLRGIYDQVEALPEGSTVLLSLDYDPASQPELEPFTRAVVRHLLRKGAKIVFLTLWDKSPPIIQAIIRDVIVGEYGRGEGFFEGSAHPEYRYGTHYAFLGYKEGKEIVIAGIGRNLRQMYPTDYDGTPVARLPVMERISSLADFPLIINSSAGFPGAKEYVQQVVARYDLNFAAATTAVSVTDLTPYYPNQIRGLCAGMRGSAEYEQLLGYSDIGTAGLNVLTFGQLLVIFAILLGNAIYFLNRRLGRSVR